MRCWVVARQRHVPTHTPNQRVTRVEACTGALPRAAARRSLGGGCAMRPRVVDTPRTSAQPRTNTGVLRAAASQTTRCRRGRKAAQARGDGWDSSTVCGSLPEGEVNRHAVSCPVVGVGRGSDVRWGGAEDGVSARQGDEGRPGRRPLRRARRSSRVVGRQCSADGGGAGRWPRTPRSAASAAARGAAYGPMLRVRADAAAAAHGGVS